MQALNISDTSRCQEAATASNDTFCSFHSKQCYGLYRGYKRRNAQLDQLIAHAPDYVTKNSLGGCTFADVDDEATLQALQAHLFQRYQLLDRVVRARSLHRAIFYGLDLDYGHQVYIDRLSGQKFTVLRALERLERRTADVLFSKKKWFAWVKQCQEDEDAQRENEKKKVQQEAKLWKQHWRGNPS